MADYSEYMESLILSHEFLYLDFVKRTYQNHAKINIIRQCNQVTELFLQVINYSCLD